MAKTSLGKVSVLPKGEYSSVIQYSRLDIVTYKGSSYLCIKDSLGIEITNEEYWQLLAQKGDTGETGATGAKGDKGDAGKDFSIYKTYPSISAMESDASNVPEGEFVLIASDVEDTDNAKLYVKSNTGFVYLTDLSGATGIKGEKGDKPINGVDYNTPEEKEEFKNEVVQNATVEVEQNIANIQEQAIQEFNSNASTKTNEYNSNTTTKLQEYNTNANTKIEEYNSNATQKTNTFNGNATTQIETFNNNATSKTNDFNSNASTKTEEFNAVVDAEKEQFAGQTEAINHHIAVVSDELERVKNDVLETGTDNDTFVHLEDSAMAEYQELSVDGVCEQKTTTGKNLLDNSKYNDGTFYSYSNGKITYKQKDIRNLSQIGEKEMITLPPGTYTIKTYLPQNWGHQIQFLTSSGDTISNIHGDVGTFTLTQETTMFIKPLISLSSNATLSFNFNIQIEQGSIPTDYEPYTGGQPSPNPDYPQEIKTIENSLKITSCNKNLFDKDNVENGYRLGADGLPFYDDRNTLSQYIKVKPNTTYHTNFKLIWSNCICEYSKDKTFILRNQSELNTFTTSNNCEYIRITCLITQKNELQLQQGTQETPYEQHLETQIQANLPEGEFIGKIDDTYKDTLKVEYNEKEGRYHLMLDKKVGKKVFDGSDDENWKQSFVNNSVYNIFIDDIKPQISQYVAVNNVISDRFFTGSKSYNDIVVSGAEYSGYITATNDGHITFKLSNMTSITMFKEWLSNNITTAYYPLKEEKILDLGVIDMPITYDEVTNIFTDSDLMPTINAKYYRNFITTIQNLQVNEKALKEELVDINSRLSALESATTNVASESESEVK